MNKLAMMMGAKALVLKEAFIDENGADGVYVRLAARNSGFMAWLMARMGIDTTTRLEIRERRIDFTEGSLSGKLTTSLPMANLAEVKSAVMKPYLLFVLGMAGCVFGLLLALYGVFSEIALAILGLVIVGAGVGILIAYRYKKTVTLSYVSTAATTNTLMFKRSFIEGVEVNEKTAERIVEVMSNLIDKRN